MRNSTLRKLLAFSAIAFLLLQSCKDDAYLTKQAPTPDQSFVEEFDTMQAAQSRGWLMRNRSEPIGRGLWTQGMTGLQASGTTVAYSSRSTNVGFISADYTMCHQAGPGGGDISSFVISPRIIMQNGDRITLDVAGRSLHLHVDDAELARRLAVWKPPVPRLNSGYWKLYIDHVTQADEGCDLDFLRGQRGAFVPKDNH